MVSFAFLRSVEVRRGVARSAAAASFPNLYDLSKAELAEMPFKVSIFLVPKLYEG